jgi:hypothetical protein
MKYYCKNCGCVLTEGKRRKENCYDIKCPLCFYDSPKSSYLEPVPDYETPAQYEKCTGQKFPENGAVWVGNIMREDWIKDYCVEWTAVSLDQLYNPAKEDYILCVNSPTPPPNDWKPEEAQR